MFVILKSEGLYMDVYYFIGRYANLYSMMWLPSET
jgi:hypothetical protein